ncbi:MAG: sulfatase-like hydrolase/transferase [Bryobacterales bacterium]|nr:sulfatase-like hydrolase/transferase [Bryobacterales bacterium]
MNRREAIAGVAAMPSAAHRPQARQRNILFLLSDQHRPDGLGIEGNAHARTPRLDGLARQGVRFSSAYCTDPVCTPSRASIFSGLYTRRHRAFTNATPWAFDIKTAAHHFSRAGYMTAAIGKMHFVDAQTHGFDYRMDFNEWYQYLGPKTSLYADELNRANSGSGLPQIAALWEAGDPWAGHRNDDRRKGLVATGRASRIREEDHFESFVARESVRFLKNHGGKQPFFLVSGFLKPHDPFMPAERFARMFPGADMKLPDTWGKVNLSNVPVEIRKRIENHAPTPEVNDPAAARQRIAMYWANVAQLDESIGHVLDALRELDLEKDTIVVYSSDHGEMLGDHGLFQKFVFYEPSIGVPLIFRAPGMGQGEICRTPASLASLVATFCELCDVPAPSNLDGPSLVPQLRAPGKTSTPVIYAEFASHTKAGRAMIRKGALKYSHYFSDTPELYDLANDPLEMRNLAESPAYKSRLNELHSQLVAWRGTGPS